MTKTIFFLDYPSMNASWKLTNKIKYSHIIKWKGQPITICTNMDQSFDYQIEEDEQYIENDIPFLKSHLQKCIRRKNNKLAIETALHMIRININEFLRRFSIIILEDVYLHQSYPTIVWLIAATSNKSFSVNKFIIDWLLGFINTLCNIDKYVEYDEYNIDEKIFDITDKYDIVYSIQFRIIYGGMKCDMNMLNYMAKLWFHRLENNIEQYDTTPIESINSDKIQPLSEWIYEAIDYHCFPYIIKMLRKNRSYTEDEIKDVIWNYNSKINYRHKINNDNDDSSITIWNDIKDDLKNIQQNILKKIHCF